MPVSSDPNSNTRRSLVLNHMQIDRKIAYALLACFMPLPAHAATTIPITVNLSETVNVTGTPRIAVDVGGTTRYATYTSGTSSNTLTFTLSPQAGDVDLDGVTVSSPIDLNGGTIKDTKGNNAALTFTPPSTVNVKVNYPSLGMDFVYDADGRYTLNGTVYNDLTSFLSAAGGTFTRASIATYFDSTGTLQTATSGTPRFDYNPTTHSAKGILIEEARTNILTSSANIAGTGWGIVRANVTSNAALAPDGTMTASHFYNNGVAGGSYVRQTKTYTANTVYSFSIYAKKAELDRPRIDWYASNGWAADGMVICNLTTGTATTSGTVLSYSITPLDNGWYRCQATAQFGATTQSSNYPAITLHINPLDSVSGIYLWGAQVEQGAFPTSYIPTTTAAVTRAADNLTIPTGSWLNASKGTLFAKADVTSLGGTAYPRIAYLNDGSVSNSIGLYVNDAGADQKSAQVVYGGVGVMYGTGAAYTAGNLLKSGITYELNNVIAAHDGVLTGLDTSVDIPTVSSLHIGRVASSYLNGHLQAAKYYPTRVPDTQLQLLTQ